MNSFLRLLTFIFLIPVTSTPAWAWGERGHDLIARAAVRLAAERVTEKSADNAGDKAFANTLLIKEHMFGHLANVPDIVWRNAGKEIEEKNAPTHYIDLEYLDPVPTFDSIKENPQDLLAHVKELCKNPPASYTCPESSAEEVKASSYGSNPYRIRQLFNLMKQSFIDAKNAPPGESGNKARNKAVDQAILYGGVMAHFVGDMGNPMHATRDYNGYERDQGGLHNFFETEVVNAYGFDFDQSVFLAAKKLKPMDRLEKQVPKTLKSNFRQDPFLIGKALTFDSYSHLQEIFSLDKKFAVTKPGKTDHGMKLKAERRPPKQVAGKFRALITDRMAVAADALASLWLQAYEQAGKPDLTGYQSWDYPTTPTFVEVDY